MSDPPVREAGTVQADGDELVIFTHTHISRPISQNYSNNLDINWSGVQVEGEGLLHQLNLFK